MLKTQYWHIVQYYYLIKLIWLNIEYSLSFDLCFSLHRLLREISGSSTRQCSADSHLLGLLLFAVSMLSFIRAFSLGATDGNGDNKSIETDVKQYSCGPFSQNND